MADLLAEIRALALAVVRAVILLIMFGIVSWPFGGPFHLLHLLTSPVITAAGWPGYPGG